MLGRIARETALKHYGRSMALSTRSFSTRSFSTPTPDPKPTPSTPAADVLASEKKKHKAFPLEQSSLQPKTSTSASPSNEPPAAHLSRRRALPAAPPPTPVEEQGITAMIRHDIEHAEKLGILKAPPPDAHTLKVLMFKTWEMTKFYCRGVRTTYEQGKEVHAIKKRVRSNGKPISRTEHRLMRTYSSDIAKLIPFVLIAFITEEIIPVVAIYAPFLLPSTFILPAQQNRIERKRSEKAAISTSSNIVTLRSLTERSKAEGVLPDKVLYEPNVSTVVCSLLQLPTYGFDFWRARRIRSHFKFIARDDELLNAEKSTPKLSNKELETALWERGIMTSGLKVPEQQEDLRWWLNSVQGTADPLGRRLHLLVRKHSEI